MTLPATEDIVFSIDKAVPPIREEHLAAYRDWDAHDYVPWSDGKNYAFLGGVDYADTDVTVPDGVRQAVVLGLLTKDHMPSIHRLLSQHYLIESDWGQFAGRWTAEENNHNIALRDHVVVSRLYDPERMELLRLETVTRGYLQYDGVYVDLKIDDAIAMMVFHEELSADFFARAAALAPEGGLKQTLELIAQNDATQAVSFGKLLDAALNFDEPRVKATIARQAELADPIGAKTAEDTADLFAAVAAAGIATPERHAEIVAAVRARYGV